MLWRSVIKTVAKYTDDKIILGLILKWLLVNRTLLSLFGFCVERKFKLDIKVKHDENQIKTDFHISCGWFIFKRELNISDIQKKKKYKPKSNIIDFQQVKKSPVVYIDKEKEKEVQSDIEKEFYAWKRRVLAKKLGIDIA